MYGFILDLSTLDVSIRVPQPNSLNTGYTPTVQYVEDNFVSIRDNETIAGNKTFSGTTTVQNLIVNGTTTTVNSNEVNIGDSIILLNSDATGSPTEDGGFEVERGNSTNVRMVWDESADEFVAGPTNNLQAVVLRPELTSGLNTKENAFTKRTAFNKNFGTTSGTVTQGNDARLSDTRVPKAHTHPISDVVNLQTTLNSKVNDTGNEDIGGIKRFTGGYVQINSSGNPYLEFLNSGTRVSYIQGVTNRLLFNAFGNSLSMYSGYTLSSEPIRGVDETNTASYVTRAGINSLLNGKENTFGKNTAFNKNFGTTAGTVTQGNDSRLSDTRTPKTHTHPISQITNLQSSLNAKENTFSKNTAFNKNFGTSAGTVTQGNDSRLSNARTPTAHTHAISDITSLQSSLNAKENAFSKNTAFNKNFGTTSGTVTQGNDSRLSNARTPTAHTHAISDITILQSSLNAKANLSGANFTGNVAIANATPMMYLSGTTSNNNAQLIF